MTSSDLLRKAAELRPFVEQQATETERLTHISEELHSRFEAAGFYRMLMPKRYGGFETDLPTYVKVWMEIARADPSAAWCGCLAANHALQVSSYWPERTQDEVLGKNPNFRAASVGAPLSGFARKVDGGWELNGKVAYCSGIPYSTHYVGQALPEPAEKDGPPGPPLLFVAPRSAFQVLDDWGQLTGMIGSGSNSIVFDKAVVPDHYVLEHTFMGDMNVSGGTIGSRLHKNSMYATRGVGFFTMTVGAVMVGAALGALDEFEKILRARKTVRTPFGQPWAENLDYQRWFGKAVTRLKISEIAVVEAASMQMEYGRATVEDGRPYTIGDDQLVGAVAREAYSDAWDTFQSWIFRYAGSSAGKRGAKLERVLRDMAIGWSHFNTALNDWCYTEVAKARLGLPPGAF